LTDVGDVVAAVLRVLWVVTLYYLGEQSLTRFV
jgi:hypothetical protein